MRSDYKVRAVATAAAALVATVLRDLIRDLFCAPPFGG